MSANVCVTYLDNGLLHSTFMYNQVQLWAMQTLYLKYDQNQDKT